MRSSIVQWRPTGLVDVSTFGNKLSANLGQALECRQHQRALVLSGARLDIDLGPGDQNSRHLDRRLPQCKEQPVFARWIERVDVKTPVQQGRDRVNIIEVDSLKKIVIRACITK